ncbi:gliding motility-associated ABC transporter ATP-binding subunit GldA [Brumimicrobium aurantiacum]|uniref:Gliding motility-associated ABC transporter ATP-binding subunit GldA n=1 Tax=Brumimicrobium aurantiacum TaxID=1737063 RepID=A0A3E1F0Y8_9FLAO|nr:gliding motility-associated ABC transporter ATP-binding subunit GldA [Brumimicrobium aurantiacum]RFC55492.1 gliding motility-associated ABC transporter ATP-binding subunit GldA [Brumimicrobium aurantiacum]
MSISVKHLTKYYGEQAAVDNISFEAKNGEILGFLGPNGAGKSTTMKIITSFIPATEGEVEVCGLNLKKNSLQIRKKIGYLPEHNPLYLDMYVKEYLSFVGKIYGVKKIKNRVAEVIELVGLQKEQHKEIGQLSKGYRQRVGLAQAIIHDPEVLILDEPTSGLDPNQLVDIRELIKKIGKEKTVMLSTHIMQEVEAICDRVIIIKNGKLVANAKASELQSDVSSQVVFVEFDGEVSRNRLAKVSSISRVESVSKTSFLISSDSSADLRKTIAAYAKQENLLILTIRKEEKSLEEVFKQLTR